MGLATRRRTRIALVLLALLGAAAAWDGMRLAQRERWNTQISHGDLPADQPGLAPHLRFAHAARLAAAGQGDAALKVYRALQADPVLGQAARYNSGNLLLRQAAVLRAGEQPGQAVALIELAKENYRDLLRDDPGHWDARYNLERAQRLLPDPEEVDPSAASAPNNAERAATTMRGYSPGLP